MFTWICPKCGLEVPPSSSECPECAARQGGRVQVDPAWSTPAVEPNADAARTPAPPAPKVRKASGSPPWPLALAFIIALLSMGTIGFVAYRYLSHKGEPVATEPLIPGRRPAPEAATSATPNANVLNKYIEVTGLRLLEETPQALQVAFVVVNHSPAPLTDVTGTVTIRPITAGSSGESVGLFNFRLPELGPYSVIDMKAPLQSKLRVYELPDWQFIRADVVITSPRPEL